MKNKFIRVLSPITFCVIALLDIAIISYGVFAIKKIIAQQSAINIIFLIIEIFAFLIGFFVTKDIFSYGVKFDDEKFEFTALDNDNVFEYINIEKIETKKDTKASLKKNFVDRYSNIIIYQKDNSVVTVELGLTTNKTLKKITTEIESRIR